MNTMLKMNNTMNKIVLQLVLLVQFYTPTTVNRQEGQGMVEYALIIALVAIALVVALQTLGGGIGEVLARITKYLG